MATFYFYLSLIFVYSTHFWLKIKLPKDIFYCLVILPFLFSAQSDISIVQ